MAQLARPKSHSVALLFRLDNAYQRGVCRGAVSFLRGRSDLTICESGGAPFLDDAKLVAGVSPDGVIGYLHRAHEFARQTGPDCNLVSIAREEPAHRFGVVCSDDRAVGALAAEHFAEIGLVQVAAVSRTAPYGRERVAGFAARAAERRLTCTIHEPPPHLPNPWVLDSWQREVAVWLQSLPRPCGVYCPDDRLALTIYSILCECGLRIPEEIALVGTDNDELLMDLIACPITSIELDLHRIGHEAARLLDAMFDDPTRAGRRVLVPPLGIVRRASTGLRYGGHPGAVRILERMRAAPGHPWRVDDLVAGTGLSRRHAERRFRELTGRSIYSALIDARLDAARELLRTTDHPISLIAERCGFCDQRQLGLLFRRRYRSTPGGVRRRRALGP